MKTTIELNIDDAERLICLHMARKLNCECPEPPEVEVKITGADIESEMTVINSRCVIDNLILENERLKAEANVFKLNGKLHTEIELQQAFDEQQEKINALSSQIQNNAIKELGIG